MDPTIALWLPLLGVITKRLPISSCRSGTSPYNRQCVCRQRPSPDLPALCPWPWFPQ